MNSSPLCILSLIAVLLCLELQTCRSCASSDWVEGSNKEYLDAHPKNPFPYLIVVESKPKNNPNAIGKQPISNQASNKQVTDKLVTSKQATDKQVTSKQDVDKPKKLSPRRNFDEIKDNYDETMTMSDEDES
ncbi:uncharacterized protein [Lepeophtheirus salmonis]|uniref:uncharacterized protein n=1 Tax=Lepeophtheirus salmonis TaxID=72036 RepID=UPI003AF3D1F9